MNLDISDNGSVATDEVIPIRVATHASRHSVGVATSTAIRPLEEFFRDVSYVTLKLTNGCNLKCSYCNVEADHPSTPRMSIETYRHIAELLIKNSRSRYVGLEFHGGEPLLLTDEWFKEAVAIASDLAQRYGKQVEHPMQTNATRLTNARIDLLEELGIRVGVSVDGPPPVNDVFRQAGQAVDRALRRLRAKNIRYTAILVLSKANFDRMPEVMAYFEDVGLYDFMINPVQPQGFGMEAHLLDDSELLTAFVDVCEYMVRPDTRATEEKGQPHSRLE